MLSKLDQSSSSSSQAELTVIAGGVTTEKTGADGAATEKTGATVAVELEVGTGEVMVVTGVGCCHFFPRDRTASKDGRDGSEIGGCSVSLVSSEQNLPVRSSPDLIMDNKAAEPSMYSGGGCLKG